MSHLCNSAFMRANPIRITRLQINNNKGLPYSVSLCYYGYFDFTKTLGYFGLMVPPFSVKPCHFERSCNYTKKTGEIIKRQLLITAEGLESAGDWNSVIIPR